MFRRRNAVRRVAIFAVVILWAALPVLNADTVILTDGTKIEGKVVEETEEHVKIETENGTKTIPRDSIREVRKQEPPKSPEPEKTPAPSKDKVEPEKPLFTFVHLTDSHCLTTKSNPGKPPKDPAATLVGIKINHWKDLVNSFGILSGTVNYINKEVKPNFVIHTGDVTDKSSLADLKKAKKILDTLKCPYHACQGDHDAVKTEGVYNYLKVFKKRCASFDCKDWHFIMMGIYPSEKELKWLEEDLDKSKEKKVVFFTHRLIAASQLVRFAFKQAGVACLMPKAEKVKKALKEHGNVVMVLSGHVHMNLWMREEGMDTAFTSTDALGERPHQFKLFKVYEDRIEITLFTGHTAKDIESGEKGKWTSKAFRTLKLSVEKVEKKKLPKK